jgi:hypothetical protein
VEGRARSGRGRVGVTAGQVPSPPAAPVTRGGLSPGGEGGASDSSQVGRSGSAESSVPAEWAFASWLETGAGPRTGVDHRNRCGGDRLARGEKAERGSFVVGRRRAVRIATGQSRAGTRESRAFSERSRTSGAMAPICPLVNMQFPVDAPLANSGFRSAALTETPLSQRVGAVRGRARCTKGSRDRGRVSSPKSDPRAFGERRKTHATVRE